MLINNFFKMISRRILKLIFRNISLKRTIKYYNRSLTIFLSPDSQLKYLKKNFDEQFIKIIESNISKNKTILDIGANCGVFGFMCLLKKSKKIYFFEPDLFLSNLIQRSIDLNKLNNICTIIPLALYKKNQFISFDISDNGRAANSISKFGGSQKGNIRNTNEIYAIKLDELIDYINGDIFIKIDIEGAEQEFIKGAKKFIKLNSPTILIELSLKNKNKIISYFESLNYNYEEVFTKNYLFKINRN